METVSVIIPYHDTDPALFDACIDSLRRQTVRASEVILVDDRSTPENAARVDETAEQLTGEGIPARAFHIAGEVGGVSRARNVGLADATGTFVCFLDADDMWHPSFLSEMLAGIRKTDADVAVCDICTVACPADVRAGLSAVVAGAPAVRYDGPVLLRHINAGYCTNKMYRRTAIGDIRYREGLVLLEDALFVAEVLDRVRNGVHVQAELYLYRKHAGATGLVMNPEKFRAAIHAADEIADTGMVREDPDNTAARRAFRASWRLRYMMALADERKDGWKSVIKEQKHLYRRLDAPGIRRSNCEKIVYVGRFVTALPTVFVILYLKMLNKVRLRHWKRIRMAWVADPESQETSLQ